MPDVIRIALGLILGAMIAYLALQARSLNRGGAWAAALTGGLVFGFGGLAWSAVLLSFFISSSALSRLFAARKSGIDEKYAKGSRRDWAQVLANGGLGAILAVAFGMFPNQQWQWIAFSGAMAAVTADTWATEIGVLNPTLPRLITNGRVVERGTSGAVTLMGYMAVLAGSALIGVVAALFETSSAFLLIGLALIAGLAGSSVDSLLGATLQAVYYCPVCKKETERHPRHSCGALTIHKRGWSRLNNDWVNFICSLVGASAALVTWLLLA